MNDSRVVTASAVAVNSKWQYITTANHLQTLTTRKSARVLWLWNRRV